MIKQQHKKPAIRAFTGIAGSPLSKLADVTPVSTTKPKVEASKPISDKDRSVALLFRPARR